MLQKVTVDEQARTITIVLDLDKPSPSTSGKTLVIASTHGNASSSAQFDGKPIVIGCNAYIRLKG